MDLTELDMLIMIIFSSTVQVPGHVANWDLLEFLAQPYNSKEELKF